MRKFTIILVLIFTMVSSFSFAKDTVRKKTCMSAIGYESTSDNLKKELLMGAKRLAVGELFGELITSFTKVKDFTLAEDTLTSSSAGLIRVKGNPVYTNGRNFGEVCVEIEAFVTDEDRKKFLPKKISKKYCASNSNMTTKEIMKHTKEQAIVSALINYEPGLEGIGKDHLLPIVHEVRYLESRFIPDTETFCVKFEGLIYPIELSSLVQNKKQYMPSVPLVESLSEGAFSASSFWQNHQGYKPANAKFSFTTTESNWSAGSNNPNQWLQVDLGYNAVIRAIGTKGRCTRAQQWVTSYKLSYSEDGSNWKFYKQNGADVIFRGNNDINTEVHNKLPHEIVARFVRFHPVTWRQHITMRVEIYGIKK